MRHTFDPAPDDLLRSKHTQEFRELRPPKIPYPYRNYTPRTEPSISLLGEIIKAKSNNATMQKKKSRLAPDGKNDAATE